MTNGQSRNGSALAPVGNPTGSVDPALRAAPVAPCSIPSSLSPAPVEHPWVPAGARRRAARTLRTARRSVARAAARWLMLAAAAAMPFGQAARAADTLLYWDTNGATPGSGAATGTWDAGTTANWSLDPTGSTATQTYSIAGGGSAADFFFSAGTNGTAGTVTLSGALLANSLTFQNNAALTLSGGTSLTLGGGAAASGLFVLAGDNAANAISTALAFGGGTAETFSNAGTGVLTISGGVTGTAALTLSNTSATANALTISGGSLNNTGTVTSTGSAASVTSVSAVIGALVSGVNVSSGTLTLGGVNLYTGTTSITGGTLSIAADTALGAAATGVSLNGGTLKFTASPAAYTHVVTVGSSGGTINIAGGQPYFHTTNTLMGSGALTVSGAGTITFGTNAGNLRDDVVQGYSGVMTLNSGGSFEYGAAGAVAAGASFVIGNQGNLIVNAGVTLPNAVTVSGGTNSILSFENTTAGNFAGPITLNANAIVEVADWYQAAAANAQAGTISGVVSGAGGLTITANGGTGANVLTLTQTNSYLGGTTVNIPAGTVNVSANNGLGTGSITMLGGTLAIGTGATQSSPSIIYPTGGAATTINGAGTVNLGAAGTIDASAVNTALVNSISAVVTGTGGVTIKGSGDLSDTGGGAAGYFSLTGANTITGNVSITAGLVNPGATDAPFGAAANVIVLNGGGLLATANATYQAGRTIQLAGTGYLRTYNGVTLTINGPITGAGTLRKTDGGAVTLAGANTYSGATVINNGTLNANAAGALGTSNVSVGGGTLTESVANALNGPAQTLTLTSGTVNLSQANSYAGTTTMSGGALNASAAGALGTGTFAFSGGTFAQTAANALSGASQNLTLTNGTLALSQANSYGGTTTMSGGTLNASAAGALGTSGLLFSGGTYNQSAANVLNGPAQTVTVSNGTLTFAQPNSYGGATTVTGGTLSIANGTSGSATGTSAVALNGGTLNSPAGAAGTVTGSISGTVTGSGTIAHTIAPGTAGFFGGLSLGGLTTTSKTTLNFDLGVPFTVTPVTTGDLLTISSASGLTIGANTPITFGSLPTAAGSYRLISYNNSGTIANFNNLILPTAPAGGRTTYALDFSNTLDPGTGSTSFLDLKVTATAAVAPQWALATGGSWNVAGNWSPASVPNTAGDTANFLTSIVNTNAAVTLDAAQHVATVNFNNAGNTGIYTISAGAGGSLFLDNGASTATINNAALSNVISGPVVLASSTNVIVANAPDTLTISGAISGLNGLSLDASSLGTLALTNAGANSFLGPISVNGGTFAFTADNQLGNAANGIVLNGGTLSQAGATSTPTLGAGRVITVSAPSAINVAGLTNAGKLVLGTAGQLTGTGSLSKGGTGDLQLGQANAGYSGNWTVNLGTVDVQNATALGSGTVLVNAGGELAVANVTVGNNVTLAGGTLSADSGNNGNLTGSLTVSSPSQLGVRDFFNAATARNFTVSGPLSGSGDLTLAAPTAGNGTVTFTGTNAGYTGAVTVSSAFGTFAHNGASAFNNVVLNGGNFGLVSDGTQTAAPEIVNFADTFTVSASSGISVGRQGNAFAPLFTSASNKILAETNPLSIGAFTLTVTNNNGYGLDFTTGGVSMNGATATTFSVVNATASNVTQGMYIDGVLSSGAGASTASGATILVKAGVGTLALTNGNNTFGNPFSNQIINITGGILAVTSDGALGDPSNQVQISTNSLTQGFRAYGGTLTAPVNITSNRNFLLNAASSGIDVASFTTLNLTSAFVPTPSNAALGKNDGGTLILSASNAGWSGAITVNDGVLQASGGNSSIFGSGVVTVAPITGAVLDSNQAVQLAGGATITNPLTINGIANGTSSGINFGGTLESVSGTNTWSGAITLGVGGTTVIGSTSGTLNLTGGITGAFNLTLAGAGNGNVSTVGIGTGAGTLTKIGSGTWSLNAANTFTGNITVNAGTLALAGNLGALPAAGTATITVQPGGTFTVDDTSAHLVNRLGTGVRPVALNGGGLTLKGNTGVATVETIGTGTLTLGSGGSLITLDATGNTVGGLQFNIGTLAVPAASATAVLAGTGLGGTVGAGVANLVAATPNLVGGGGAAGTTFMSIRPDILGSATVGGAGTGFVTSVATTGFRVLTAGEQSASLMGLATANVALAGAQALAATTTANSLTLKAGSSVSSLNFATVNVGAAGGAGLLALGAANTVNGTLINPAGPLFVHTVGNLTLAGGSSILGTSIVTKADAGTLAFQSPQFYNAGTTINGGTVQLASGATNTLLAGNALILNAGGTLDLNGGVQYIGALSSQGAAFGAGVAGGTVTSSAGSGTLVVNSSAAANFAGTITGANVTFIRSGNANNVTLLGPLTYGGPTLINGGNNFGAGSSNGTILADNGAITNSSSITLNFATLSLDNSRMLGNVDRINDAIPITSNGGGLNFQGRDGTLSTETVGAVTLASGTTVIGSANHSFGASGSPFSTDFTLTSLTRTAAAGATVDFSQNYNGNSSGTLGNLGNNHRILIGGQTNTNNIMGGYAIVTQFFNYVSGEYASYNPIVGVGPLNTTGFAGYDGTAFPTGNSFPTQNIRLGSTAASSTNAVPSGGLTINSLNLAVQVNSGTAQTGTAAITFANAGDVLNLTSGGLMSTITQNNNGGGIANTIAGIIGTAALPGKLTAGGLTPGATSDLFAYFYNTTNTNALTINSQITDNTNNGGSSVRLVAFGGDWGAGNITLANNTNNYTGGTVVNQETLTIAATGNLPGNGLTINGGTVTQVAGGAIANQAVALNGNATLTLAGNNVLTSLTFNNIGGNSAPTVTTGGVLTLPVNAITASSSNVATTAVINGTLDFANLAPTVTVKPIAFNGQTIAPLQATLNVGALIQNAGQVTVAGGGTLQLSSATSTFSGGVNLTANSGLIIGASSNVSTVGGVVTAGPLGTGTLTVGAGSALLSSAAANTVSNAVSFSGDAVFNGITNLTLNGTVALPSTVNATVTAPQMTATLGGVVSGAATSFTKNGLGTLVMSNPGNTFAGPVTINAGTLAVGSDGATTGSLGAAPGSFAANAITINGGYLGTAAAAVSLSANRGITIGANGGGFNPTTGQVLTINGSLSGSGPIAQIGAGTTVLNGAGASTFTGGFLVSSGTLQLNTTAAANSNPITLGGGTLAYVTDGNGLTPVPAGTGTPETVNFNDAITVNGNATISVARNGTTFAPLYAQASNKTVQVSTLSIGGQTLTVTPSSGYGLLVNGAVTLAGTPTFSVGTATASNVVQGLTISGQLTSAAGAPTGNGAIILTKAGAGTLALNNPSDATTFGGLGGATGQIIDVTAGVLATNGDGALGVSSNIVRLASGATFRDFGNSFTLAHTLSLNAAATNVEVTAGQALSINSALTLSAATNVLTKNDDGILILGGSNGFTGTGGVNVLGGVVQIANNGAVGSGVLTANGAVSGGAAIQLAGVSVSNAITINGTGGGYASGTGINGGGELQAVASVANGNASTASGTVLLSTDAWIGADANTTLNLSGTINAAHYLTFNVGSSATINVTGTFNQGTANNVYNIEKLGTGLLNVNANLVFTNASPKVAAGTFVLSGANGKLAAVGANDVFSVFSGGTLQVNDSAVVANRLGGNAVTLFGGTLNYVGNGGASSSEVAGILTANRGLSVVSVTPGGGTSTALTFASLAQSQEGAVLFSTSGIGSIAATTYTFTGAGAAGAANKGIIGGWALVDPTGSGVAASFATASANGSAVRALTASEYSTDLGVLAGNNIQLTNTAPSTNTLSINSLTLGGTGALTINGNQTLTITSGGILAQSGYTGTGITGGGTLATGTGVLNVHAVGNLNINTAITGSGGIAVDGGGGTGTVTLNAQTFVSNNTSVGSGTLSLGFGNNTLLQGNYLVSNGGTLQLNSNAQAFYGLYSDNQYQTGVAGKIVGGSGAALVTGGASNNLFAGTISGGLTVSIADTAAAAGSPLNLAAGQIFTQNNTYTGATIVNGGQLTLEDNGRLSGTSSVAINYATLALNENNLTDLTGTNRINNAATITLSGGTLSYQGRAQTASVQTVGPVVLNQGMSNVFATAGGTGVNSADLILGGLSNTNDSMVNFSTAAGGSAPSGAIGSNARVQITGQALTNNIIGPWAISLREFASYNTTYGVGALNAAGFAGYSPNALAASDLATDNIRITGSNTPLTANTTINTLNVNYTANTTIDLGGHTLDLQGGGLMLAIGTNTTTATVQNGNVTSGVAGSPSDLYVYFLPYAGTSRLANITSPIVDNGVSGAVKLVLFNTDSGANVLTLNGANTYTGGTVINGGQIVLGSTGVLPVSANGITLNQAILTQTAGGVLGGQAVTLNGVSTLTLVGANSLAGITFNNSGGGTGNPTVTTGGILTLTNNISATPNNLASTAVLTAPSTATIAGTLDFGGNTRAVNVAANLVNGQDVAQTLPGLNISALIQNGTLAKNGAGNLLLSSALSTFAGGVNVNAGGIFIGASSTPTAAGTITSGPVGTGTLTLGLSDNTSTNIVLGTPAGTFTLGNPFVLNLAANGTLTFLNSGFSTANTLVINGPVTLPNTAFTIAIPNPVSTLKLLGGVTGSGAINKTGLGALVLSGTAGVVTLNGGGPISFLSDGDGTSTPNVAAQFGGFISNGGPTTVTLGRLGTTYAPYYTQAINHVIQLTNAFDSGGNQVTVNNNNGYGLESLAPVTLVANQTYNVATATASNLTQGLILTGAVTGNFGIVKTGAGALVLNNNTVGVGANTFGSGSSIIDIQGGIVSAGNAAALGAGTNVINVNTNASTAAGFRATGTYTLSNTVNFAQAANAIEVTGGNTLTLSSPFTFNGASTAAAAGLAKNDNGILTISAANGSWGGPITINAGAIQVQSNTALGTGGITITPALGAALQLAGGVTINNALILNNSGTNQPITGGLNGTGSLENVSGNNFYSGVITPTFDAIIGSDAGSLTLNAVGGINNAGNRQISFTGAGTINLGTLIGTSSFQLNKYGSGTLNITTAQTNNLNNGGGGVQINGGTVSLNGNGAFTVAPGFKIQPGATLTLDDSTTAVPNRTTSSALTFVAGNLNYIGNIAADSTQTVGAPVFNRGYEVVTVTAQTGRQANLVFSAAANNVAAAQTNGNPTAASVLFRGASLGTAAGPGIATIADSTGGFTFNGNTGATDTFSKGILPWALVDNTGITGNGVSFATTDAAAATGTAILRPLNTTTEMVTNTISTNTNSNLTTGTTLGTAAALTTNSLTFSNNANLTLATNQLFSNSSGGILALTGTASTISGGVLQQTNGFSPLNIWTLGNLTISSTMNGGNGTASGNIGTVKAGAGTLTLSPTSASGAVAGLNTSANSMSGQTVINGGTLKLNGGTNTLAANNFLEVSVGGTLDLNGNSQYTNGLFTDGFVNGAGGTIQSSVGTGNLVVNQDGSDRNWAGTITGSVNFTKSGGNGKTLFVYSPQTYTGATLITGGTTQLRDSGAITASSQIDINYASLTLDNGAGINNTFDRIGDTIPINLRGGTITFNGRAQTASTETLGTVTLAQSNSSLATAAGGTNINSTDLTITNLVRSVGGGTVNFTAGSAIGSSSRILLSQINGVSTSPFVASTSSGNGGGLTDNIIGGWAVIGTSDFASYNPTIGVGALGSAGYAGYSPNQLSTATVLPADNININYTATTAGITANTTINSLKTSNIVVASVPVSAGATLTLSSGGLLNFTSTAWNLGNVVNQGSLTTTGPELFIYTQGGGTPTINTVITGAGVSLVKSGGNTLTLAATNTYGGGTTVNQGTLNVATTGLIPLATTPANGLIINGATVTLNAPGAIAAGNIVTNNNSTLNLFGNNTLAGVAFNEIGGTGNPTINTFSTAAANSAGATGVLTIGSSGIVVTSSDVTAQNVIVGRIDMGSSPNVINVGSINTEGVNDVAPLQAALVLQGIVNSSGGITKSGAGVLQFNAQENFTGPLTVTGGGIKLGVTNAGSRYSALTLNANTRFDLNNTASTIGSLAGAGTVFSSSGTPTLTIGFDNTSTSFAGQFSRFNDSAPNAVGLNKVGSGVLSITSAQSAITGSSGNVAVNGGGLTYTGAGAPYQSLPTATQVTSAVTFTVNAGGTLTLDNASTTNLNNRLGLSTAGQLTLQGGTFAIQGNGAASTLETLNNLTFTNGGSIVTLTPNGARPLNLVVTTLSGPNGNGSGLIQGISGAAAGNGVATLAFTNAPGLIGGQGTGLNGTSTMAVRSDLLADASVTGLGTGFLVKDTTTNLYRALAATELSATPATWGTTTNGGITASAQTIVQNAVANSITASGTSSLGSGNDVGAFGSIFGPSGLLTTTLTSNSLLVLNGGTFTSNVGSLTGPSGITLNYHVVGTGVANINSYVGIGDVQGAVKADAGTLNFNKATYFTGSSGLVVNGGTVNLNSGADNTLVVAPGTLTPTLSSLQVNGVGSLVDLRNNSQAVNALSSVNALPGQAGNIQNTGGTLTGGVASATLSAFGAGTFAGSIQGNLNFVKGGNNTTLLTNASTYAGTTTIRGGILQLRDSGSILGTSAITVNYGTLLDDNFGLNPIGSPNPTRIASTTPVTLQGGTITLNGAGSTDNTLALGAVTVTGGGNTVNVLPQINEGSTAQITINNLLRTATNHSVVNFNGFTTNNSSGTSTTGGQGLNANGQIILTQLNNSPFSATNLSFNLIGGWAVADGNTFATYVNGFGVSVMGQTTSGNVAPGFDGTDISVATTASQNISDGSSGATARTLATGAHAANSWRFAQTTAGATMVLSTGATVSLGTGIITNSNQVTTIQGADATNTITGTGADLYLFVNQNTTNINAKLTGSMALVKAGGGTLGLGSSTVAANNDYSGGTFVQAGTLNLNGAASSTIIPGDLTINNATVTMNAQQGQIVNTSNVFLNGNATLNTFGANTLASVTFANSGSTGNPTVATATSLTLSSATPITAANDVFLNTPVISGTALVLSNASPVITVSGLSPDSLQIIAPITNAGGAISESGSGSLSLAGASTFTNGFNVGTGSTLIMGIASAGTVPAITSGPVGTGTLTLADGSTILSGNNFTVGNAVTVNGNVTFGGTLAANNLTLSGAMALGATGRTFTVPSVTVTDTLSGPLTSTAAGTALTKAGLGTLVLSSAANNFGGAGVTVSGGILKNGVANAIPNASLITVNAGAEYDLNNFGQASQQIAGSGVITNSGAAAQTLVVGGTSAADVTTNVSSTFNGSITNATNALNLLIAGQGTLTLTGTNTYGNTVINAGTLRVGNGGTTGTLGVGTITDGGTLVFNRSNTVTEGTDFASTISGAGQVQQLGAGTLVLGNSNAYTGATTINTGTLQFTGGTTQASSGITTASAGTLAIVNPTAEAALNTKNLIFGTGPTTLNLTTAGQISTSASFIAASGTLTGNGATTVNVTADDALYAAGVYPLATTTGITGTVGTNFVVGTLPARLSNATLQISGNTLQLNATAGPLTNTTWTGLTTSAWDIATTPNWKVGSQLAPLNATKFYQGDSITFDDSAASFAPVLNATANPTAVVFNNTVSHTYTLSGSGKISGTTSVVVNGAGTVVMGLANDYTGTTTINGGVLSVASLPSGGTAGGIGSSSAAAGNLLLNGGTLRYTGATVSTDRQFTLGTAGGGLDGSGTGPVTFAATGAVAFTASQAATTRTLTLSGSAAGNVLAALIADNSFANGDVTAVTVATTGVGSWTLPGANTYSGETDIADLGQLVVTNTTGSATGAGPVKVLKTTTGGTLGGTGTIAGAVTLSGNITAGTSATAPGKTGTLTVNNTVTMLVGSTYVWKINDVPSATGPAAAGSADGWDLIHVVSLVLPSGSGAVTIRALGSPVGYDPTTQNGGQYSFAILTSDNPITNFVDGSQFAIDGSGFNGGTPSSAFTVSESLDQKTLFLNVPEPTGVSLMGLALLGLLKRNNRKGKRA